MCKVGGRRSNFCYTSVMPTERKSKKLVVANWKMNPATLVDATRLFSEAKKTTSHAANVQTVICPPALYLSALAGLVSGQRTLLGAQDCYFERSGAYTGEVSPAQLSSLGVRYVILGHSERRAMGETSTLIVKKVSAALKEGLVTILCVGEDKRDESGAYFNVVQEQLEVVLEKIPRRYFLNVVIAYEPVWAISSHATGTESPEDMLQMGIFIRKVLAGMCGKDLASKLPILYGGSVDERSVASFVKEAGVDGFLVGKASLFADSFNALIKNVNESASSL